MADAYEAHYGKKLDTGSQSATASWVEALAANSPLLTESDSAAAEAIGTPGQQEPFIGLVSSSKYRDTVDGKLTMKICADIKPYVGYANPSYGLISAKTKSPHLASQLTPHNAATGMDDFDKRQDWQDFWRISYKR